MFIKFVVWLWEIFYFEDEIVVYKWISDSSIGLKFLGYLMEGKDGCMVGFVVEWVEGVRVVGLVDYDGCKKVLGWLYEFGIKFGDVNKYNFFVRDGYDVLLVDFEMVKWDCLFFELEEEMRVLKSSFGGEDFVYV